MKANVLKNSAGTKMIYPHEEWKIFREEMPNEYENVIVNVDGQISRALFKIDIENNPVWIRFIPDEEDGIRCQPGDLWQYIIFEEEIK